VYLRILSGASYLDVSDIYGFHELSTYRVFYEMVRWVMKTYSFDYDVNDLGRLQSISDGFAQFSGHVLRGCIGAIDGLAIRIRCPSERDGVSDPGNYFCRKGFHALNATSWPSGGWSASAEQPSTAMSTGMYILFNNLNINSIYLSFCIIQALFIIALDRILQSKTLLENNSIVASALL